MTLIENFIEQGAATGLTGKPSMDQCAIADEITFSFAADIPAFGLVPHDRPHNGHVVILTDSPLAGQGVLNRYAAWRSTRGVEAGAGLEVVPLDMAALTADCCSLSKSFFTELEARAITPALVVSIIGAESLRGFASPEAEAESLLSRQVIERTGAAVLLAGHTGPQPQGYAGNLPVDALWEVTRLHDQTTLTQKMPLSQSGNVNVIQLACRPGGGFGHAVIRIFDAMGRGTLGNG